MLGTGYLAARFWLESRNADLIVSGRWSALGDGQKRSVEELSACCGWSAVRAECSSESQVTCKSILAKSYESDMWWHAKTTGCFIVTIFITVYLAFAYAGMLKHKQRQDELTAAELKRARNTQ